MASSVVSGSRASRSGIVGPKRDSPGFRNHQLADKRPRTSPSNKEGGSSAAQPGDLSQHFVGTSQSATMPEHAASNNAVEQLGASDSCRALGTSAHAMRVDSIARVLSEQPATRIRLRVKQPCDAYSEPLIKRLRLYVKSQG